MKTITYTTAARQNLGAGKAVRDDHEPVIVTRKTESSYLTYFFKMSIWTFCENAFYFEHH
jgi:hypothetical protein